MPKPDPVNSKRHLSMLAIQNKYEINRNEKIYGKLLAWDTIASREAQKKSGCEMQRRFGCAKWISNFLEIDPNTPCQKKLGDEKRVGSNIILWAGGALACSIMAEMCPQLLVLGILLDMLRVALNGSGALTDYSNVWELAWKRFLFVFVGGEKGDSESC